MEMEMTSFLGNPKILMVDDRPENLIVLERLLKDKPLELFCASSGNEALRMTLHHDFALALLDIQMPEMDGYELAEILRSEEKTARMPFIFISAIYTDHVHVFKGYEKGAFSFITKPFEPLVLLSKVEFFIEKYQHEQMLKRTHQFLEQQVYQRTAQLELSNRELEQFAYIASHDLQEPLRTITSFTQLLVRKYEPQLDKTGQTYLRYINEATTRMSRLIKGLLDYSRIGHDRQLVDVDCNKLLDEIERDLTDAIQQTGAVISRAGLPVVKGYQTELRLLFQNLLSNAIKFHRPQVPPKISISATRTVGFWQFSVEDNGIGIDKEYLDRIFVIFQRLHNRNEYEGTGIGLAHCRKIVELHSGTIWVESNASQGCTFCFTLMNHEP